MSKVIIEKLVARHGERRRGDIERGVAACKRVWEFDRHGRKAFGEFCAEQYIPPGPARQQLLSRLDEVHHHVTGSISASFKVIRAGMDMADRPDTPAERVIGAFSPQVHLSEDLRRFRISALIQLNFGTDDRRAPRNRAGWAARRMGDIGRQVIPAELLARLSEASTAADRFISDYNLHLDRFEFPDPEVRFAKGTKLVSHWGLRDHMMSLVGEPGALPRQRAILDLMRRVVDGQIPAEVLDDPGVRWDIGRGRVARGKSWRKAKGHGPLRWRAFSEVWQANRAIDPHTRYGNMIDSKFLGERELPEEQVVGMLTAILSSPLADRVGRYVRDNLGRELEPFDVYYRDFSEPGVGKSSLRYDIEERFPDAASLDRDIPRVLRRLGWDAKRARFIASKIRVDNARGAGHAWPPQAEHDRQLLRVRVGPGGCDEVAYETFMHELGHAVEQVLSSYEMDYRVLWGVPNTAFTEGFAFTFQDRMDEVLGRRREPPSDPEILLRFWEPFEIAGPALTEIRFYHWLYAHPEAPPAEMMSAIREIGDGVWAEFYSRVFGEDGHGLMSVYSHILWGDFYLAEYPIGYVIAYQVRKYLAGRDLPAEMERMCGLGRIYPNQWMRSAVGQSISVRPLLDDTRAALRRLGY